MACKDQSPAVASDSPIMAARTKTKTATEQTPPFFSRWQQSNDQASRELFWRELGRVDLGQNTAFSSHYRLEFEVDAPPERQRQPRREKRPGRKYAASIHSVSESFLLWDSTSPEARFQLLRTLKTGKTAPSTERYLAHKGQLWTQVNDYPWLQGPLDDDFFELWAQEQQRCIFDLLSLASTQIQIQAPAALGSPPQPGATLRFKLSLGDTSDPVPTAVQRLSPNPKPSSGPNLKRRDPTKAAETSPTESSPGSAANALMTQKRAWRSRARMLSLAGWVEMDALSGQWRGADLRLEYEIHAEEVAPFRARAHLIAKNEGRIAPEEWLGPENTRPLPLPPRYHQESRDLLRGLAPI